MLLAYCPTSDEIKNDDVKRLANRLKASSYKETLTNILEWQERNITFWTERNINPTVLIGAGLICGAIFIVGSVVLLITQSIQLLSSWRSFLEILSAILLGSIVTTLTIMIWTIRSNRKIPLRQGLKNIFVASLPMNTLLQNKLGICRDYAKLTACLLPNIYPDAEIYFATAPGHVATGIKIGNELYMLDQRLPILTKDRWNDYRKPCWYHTIKRFDPTKITLQKADKRTFMYANTRTELNTEKLAHLSKRMTELLNIRKQPDDKAISLQKPIRIPWKNGVTLYEENEMTDYSLARYLATKISSEFVRMNQITRIETRRDKNDLVFQIHVNKRAG
jgi:predicted transglutaminase-like protease